MSRHPTNSGLSLAPESERVVAQTLAAAKTALRKSPLPPRQDLALALRDDPEGPLISTTPNAGYTRPGDTKVNTTLSRGWH